MGLDEQGSSEWSWDGEYLEDHPICKVISNPYL